MEIPLYVATVLARFQGVTEAGDSWLVRCPCPGHGKGREDSNPSVRVAIGDAGRILLACRTGCPTDQILSATGLGWKDLYPSGPDEIGIATTRPAKVLTPDEAEARHLVYTQVLKFLPLEDGHRDDLRHRGFTDAEIDTAGYRSVRARTFLEACQSAVPGFDPDTYAGPVPGLREAGKNLLYSGLLLPVRDALGRIVAFKVRRAGDPKYVYLSDPGAPSGAPVHWPDLAVPKVNNALRITEGELKADLLTARTGVSTVSVPGVTNWKPLTETDRDQVFQKKVLLAFDWPDVINNAGVRTQARSLLETLADIAEDVSVESWPLLEFKGLDDLVAAGHEPDVTEGIDACRALLDSLEEPTVTLSASCVTVIDPAGPGVSPGPAPSPGGGACEFPLDVFPPAVADFVAAVSEGTDAPIDFPALTALVVGATAIGATRKIRMPRGWTEFPILYTAIVAPPGSSKSPSVAKVQRPLTLRQDKAFVKYSADLGAFEASGKKGPKPVPVEYYTSDATIAAVTDRLANNPRGILLSMDEILGWVKSFGTVGLGNDQQQYLTAWGGQPMKVDRKTGDRPMTWIRFPYISVIGGIQPEKLPELVEGGRYQDGFLSRFLFAYPEDRDLPYWDAADFDTGPADDAKSLGWNGIIDRMYDGLTFDSSGYPEVVPVTRAGWDQAVDWYNREVVDELRDPGFSRLLKGFWLKLRAYYFRLALVLEHLHWAASPGAPPKEISPVNLARAARLCTYLKCHSRKLAGGSLMGEESRQLDELVRWAWSGKKGGECTARDIVKSNNPGLPRKMIDARALLVTAQQYSAGTYYPERDGKKDLFVCSPRS